MRFGHMAPRIGVAILFTVLHTGTAQAACGQITLDIRTIDYKSKPYDPLLMPLLNRVDPEVERIELTFASSRTHPDIADLQAAGLKYIESRIALHGYDPALVIRQEVMLPRSFAGKDELYRLIIAYGPKGGCPVSP
ncbi:hypothetical protein PQU92_16280 [Asticcacaulis sp. BYS171W]|uniref:Uncharacterized protein n=1 Tax=Asticcacaulis aquaticus TaxID=2984212 RepID=A0ABT5HXU3_9CAUL|nr:hypothetical protein [Asticcacaulis aquaticus]MDC7684843.1 hypothetical protein [Asticcacaulis aquaticus]